MSWTQLALAWGLILAQVQLSLADEPQSPVRFRIIDGTAGKPVAARVYIQHSDGRWFFPKSLNSTGTAIPYQRQRSDKVVEMHTTVSADPLEVQLPHGKYTVTVERGKEYLPVTANWDVTGTSVASHDIFIRRWISMTEKGWYSGDTHLHRDLADMPNVVLAEDLNIAFPLTYWVTSTDSDPVRDNKVKSVQNLKSPPTNQLISVDPTHSYFPMNTEYEIFSVGTKPHTLGAFVVIGHQKPFTLKVPPVTPAAELAHREGGLVDLEKHSWPWSLVIVPLMKVDLFELANNHCWRTEFGFPQWTIDAVGEYMNVERQTAGLTEWGWIDFGFQTYYALLNCGFRLKPTAGTAAGVHPVPAGFGRVYVHLDGPFEYASWLDGLRKGQSFVTTGPMLMTTINGKLPGHVFQDAVANADYHIAGTIESLHPIERIEIVVNGEVARTLTPASSKTSVGGFQTIVKDAVKVPGSGWIAIRCFEQAPGKRVRFAHTSPVHIEVPGQQVAPRKAEIDYIIRRVKEEIARNQSVLTPEALAEYQKSLKIYSEIAERAR